MSDNKRYYYLKLKENFFDSDEMIVLESMPDGYKYSNILLKLYLRSLKYEGRLMFNNRIPFNSQMLAQVTRHSVGDIEKAVQVFKDLSLIEVLDNGAIYMLDIQNFIGKSSTEGDRKRKYRQKIEQEKHGEIEGGQTSGQMTDKYPPELELEKEQELERELEKEQELDFGQIVVYYERFFGEVSKENRKRLKQLANRNTISLLFEAMRIANKRENVEVPIAYIWQILTKWQNKGIKTLQEAKKEQEEFNEDFS